MYVTDRENHSIRFVTTDGIVSTLCGGANKESGWRDGNAQQALFKRPFGIAANSSAMSLLFPSLPPSLPLALPPLPPPPPPPFSLVFSVVAVGRCCVTEASAAQ